MIIAAAGNASRNRVEYPARHNHVVAVGAVRYDRDLTFYSCYGEGLDLVAPGGDLRVDQNGDGMPDGVLQNTIVRGNPAEFDYLAWQGTSMAAPHVAGVGALIYSAGIEDPDTAETILLQSADDLGDVNRFGSGLLNADHALRTATQGTSAMRATAALGLALLLFVGLRRKLDVSVVNSAGWALALGGGLGLVPWDAVGLGGGFAWLMAHGPLGSLASALGPYGALATLTVLPAFGAVALALHVKKLRPFLVGLSIASAAFLLVEALHPTLAVGLLPAAVIGPWLVVNALLALGLGALVAKARK